MNKYLFLDGKEVPYGTKGSVRPDYYKVGSSVDLKNYNVETALGRSNLANNISKQYYQSSIIKGMLICQREQNNLF